MRREDYQNFFRKYLRGEYAEADHQAFLLWFSSLDEEQAREVMSEYEELATEEGFADLISPDMRLISKIEEGIDHLEVIAEKEPVRSWRWFLPRVAAAVVLLSGLFVAYQNYYHDRETAVVQQMPADVSPGDSRALLTLSDGSSISLADVEAGEIAKQALVRIKKDNEGQLVYSPAENYRISTANRKKEYNSIVTPRSGQYRVLLPDGTKVWLNSMSSLRFPVTFDPAERRVELSGEAYFEVAKATSSGKRIPFRVVSNGQEIEVTGTRFNVNTYSDDTYIKTTLLEGGVKVQEGATGSTVDLKPGEQSLVRSESVGKDRSRRPGSTISVRKADVEGDLAWTTGYFYFKDTELREVMQQLIRWYDIDVEYVGSTSGERFNGYVSRNISLSNLLDILSEGSDVKFDLSAADAKVKVIAPPVAALSGEAR